MLDDGPYAFAPAHGGEGLVHAFQGDPICDHGIQVDPSACVPVEDAREVAQREFSVDSQTPHIEKVFERVIRRAAKT